MSFRRKVCKSCRVEKSIRHFYKSKSCVGGYLHTCKACKLQATADNYQLKRVHLLAKRRRQWRNDPEHRRRREAAIRRWAQSKRGKRIMRESRHAWAVLHPEKQRAVWRRQYHKRRSLHHEHHRAGDERDRVEAHAEELLSRPARHARLAGFLAEL